MNYVEINNCDLANGPGIRVSLFVSGCELHCDGCHNQIAWDPDFGQVFTDSDLISIFELLQPDHIDGFSLLGGDPLHPKNIDESTKICRKIKTVFPNKSIWLWTGYTWEHIKSLDIFDYIDVCCDGPYKKDLRNTTLSYVGSSNQRVIDVKKSRRKRKPVLYCNG